MFMRPTQYAPQFTRNPGLGEEAAAPASWFDKLMTAAPQIATSAAQYKLIAENVKRAKKGLPPIDSASVAPTVKVQAQLDPEIRRALFIGGGILAAAAVVAALK